METGTARKKETRAEKTVRKKQSVTIPKEPKDYDAMMFTNLLGEVMILHKRLPHPVECTDPELLKLFWFEPDAEHPVP